MTCSINLASVSKLFYHYGWTVEEVLQVSLGSITRVVSKFSMNNLDLESPCKTVQSISGELLYFFIFNDVIKKRSSELVSIQLQTSSCICTIYFISVNWELKQKSEHPKTINFTVSSSMN